MQPSARKRDTLNHAPDQSEIALLMVDVINDLEFDGGEALLSHALPMAHRLAALKRRAKAAEIPVIYANDNFGRWQSDFPKLVESCLEEDVRAESWWLCSSQKKMIISYLNPNTQLFFRPISTSCCATWV